VLVVLMEPVVLMVKWYAGSDKTRVAMFTVSCDYRNIRVYPKVSGLDARRRNCKWYSSLPKGTVLSLFCESL
jgi:hypothetical protein